MSTLEGQHSVCIKHGNDYRGTPCPTCNKVGDGPWVLMDEQLYHAGCAPKIRLVSGKKSA